MRSGKSFSEAKVQNPSLRHNIYSKCGETVIVASKGVQEILRKEFSDHSTYGRKSNMLFKSRSELCNFEFKAEGHRESEMMAQNRQNVRLNRCILEHLRRLGVSRPRVMFADFEGDLIGYDG
ncbi:hypothetical protein BGX26_002104 [Mortierella sp. AD094]|nr:hypothetical protein BGX26_002104 [Mortierella sp. AD094]